MIRRGALQSCCGIRESDVSLIDPSLHFFATTFFKNGKFENLRNLHFLKKGCILMHFLYVMAHLSWQITRDLLTGG